MAEPSRIVEATLLALRRTRQLAGCRIVVTAGPTRECIDPVRFISNRSSGKMGYALAAACAQRGAEVTLISGPVELGPPHGVKRIDVETSTELRAALLAARPGAAAVFMAAAVADWLPRPVPNKLKRSGSPLTLVLDEGPDILAELGQRREEELLIGFAAETENLLAHARAKLQRKGLDYIVANDVSLPGLGFDADDNQVTLLDREDRQWVIGPASKREVAERLVDRIFGVIGASAP
jgi:phosphopantothenoylcysteine decarboxylase/phosphopantothenate--cysteine ligase